LGGLFGDTVLGAVLNALPMSAQPGLKLIAAAAFLGGAAMLMHVAGISTGEFRATLRFLVYGLLSTGAMIVAGLRGVGTGVGRPRGNGAGRADRAAGGLCARRDHGLGEDEATASHYRPEDDTQPVHSCAAAGLPEPHAAAAAAPRPRTISIEADALQPELPQRPGAILDDDIEAPDDDRVRARISDAIRSRVRRPNP
jgi:S-DNA-T family DNA segregation ATPase FtsK/SpoIIIE